MLEACVLHVRPSGTVDALAPHACWEDYCRKRGEQLRSSPLGDNARARIINTFM